MVNGTCLEEVRISIGGISVSVDPVDKIPFRVSDAHRYFFSTSAPDITIRLRDYGNGAPRLKSEDRVFSSGGAWDLYRNGEDLVFNRYAEELGRTPYMSAVLKKDLSSGDIFVNKIPGDASLPQPFGYPLDEIIMIHILASGRGVMIHGCGLVIDGDGALFVGTSGRGKSTLSGILKEASGAAILNDDRTIVRRGGSGYAIYGTPWHGTVDECSNAAAPLKKIFFIHHADKNHSSPLKPADAAARLVACSFSPLWDKDGMRHVLDFASGIAQAVPSFDLGFLPDRTIAKFLKFA